MESLPKAGHHSRCQRRTGEKGKQVLFPRIYTGGRIKVKPFCTLLLQVKFSFLSPKQKLPGLYLL